MRVRQPVQHRPDHRLTVAQLVGARTRIGLPVERHGGLVELVLDFRQTLLRPLQDLLHREIRVQREGELGSEFLLADPEVAVRARQQVLPQPSRILLQRRQSRFPRRSEFGLHVRGPCQNRVQIVPDERDHSVVLTDCGLRVDPGRVPEVGPGRVDHGLHPLQPLPEARQPGLERREVPRQQGVQGIPQAVPHRVPLVLAQHFGGPDAEPEAVGKNLVVNGVCRPEFGFVDRLQLRQVASARLDAASDRLGGVVVEPPVARVVPQRGCEFRIAFQHVRDVAFGQGYELLVGGRPVARERAERQDQQYGATPHAPIVCSLSGHRSRASTCRSTSSSLSVPTKFSRRWAESSKISNRLILTTA